MQQMENQLEVHSRYTMVFLLGASFQGVRGDLAAIGIRVLVSRT